MSLHAASSECRSYEVPGGVAGRPTSLRKLSKRLLSHRSTQAATRGRGQLPHNLLMAGRRRRTAAAALRWPRCRCRYHSSSRSTGRGRRLRWKKKDRLERASSTRRTTERRRALANLRRFPVPEGKRYIRRRARAVGVRVEFNLRCSVIVVCSGTKCTARRSENVHRCALRDDSALLRACHGCLKRSSGGEQGEAQRGLHHL